MCIIEDCSCDELIDLVTEIFNNTLKDGLNPLQAGGRCMYEFCNVINEGNAEKIIVYLTLALLEIKNNMVSEDILRETSKIIEEFNPIKLQNELEENEIKKLEIMVNELSTEISKQI